MSEQKKVDNVAAVSDDGELSMEELEGVSGVNNSRQRDQSTFNYQQYNQGGRSSSSRD